MAVAQVGEPGGRYFGTEELAGMLPRLFLVSGVAVLTLACAHSSFTRVKTAPARLYPCELKFFASGSEVPRRFESVCAISETPGHGIIWDLPSQTHQHQDEALRRIRKIACSCGAGAVIASMPTSPGSTIDALAIRYTQ